MTQKVTFFNKNFNKAVTSEKDILYIALIIAIGLFSGTVIYIFADETSISSITESFIEFTQNFSDSKSLDILYGLLSEHITYFIFVVLFSTSVFGKAAIYTALLIKNSGIGLISAFIYCNYALKGLGYCFLVFYPSMAVFTLFMLISAKTALLYNTNLRQGSALISKTTVINYCVAFIVLILSCFVELILINSFSSLFSF